MVSLYNRTKKELDRYKIKYAEKQLRKEYYK